MPLSLPRGTSDFGPADSIRLKAMRDAVEETFKRFGFYPIETPAVELTETLSAKAYGEESRKEMYILEDGAEGLRYDFTVPLARYMSMNKDLQMPFKRYQIGTIWRRDEPQKMRRREFLQADIDVVGSTEPASDAEVIAAAAAAVERLGVSSYTVLINSRVFLDSILDMFKIPKESHTGIIRSMDKLDKVGATEAAAQIAKQGLDTKTAQALLEFVTKERDDNTALLDELRVSIPDAKPEIDRIAGLLGLLGSYGISGQITLDLSLARGFDYYTGGIWELVSFENGKRMPTIAAGGRYDKLMGLCSKKELPAVGFSIGISRIFDMQRDGAESSRTYARVYLATIGKENLQYAVAIAMKLRSSGICVDMNLTERGIAKQMEYANALRVPYVAILGNIERQAGKVKLRNMQSGDEKMLTIDECVKELK